jgi:membrane protein implicated in regulation of membrane protease activity
VEREPASSWYRQQVRQALAFGLRCALWGTLALVWPLVLSLLLGNATATIVFYLIAIVVDAVLLAVWFKRAFRYSKRASRGETFSLRPAQRQSATRGIPVKH